MAQNNLPGFFKIVILLLALSLILCSVVPNEKRGKKKKTKEANPAKYKRCPAPEGKGGTCDPDWTPCERDTDCGQAKKGYKCCEDKACGRSGSGKKVCKKQRVMSCPSPYMGNPGICFNLCQTEDNCKDYEICCIISCGRQCVN